MNTTLSSSSRTNLQERQGGGEMKLAFDQSPVLKKYDYQNAAIAVQAAQQGNLVLIGYYNTNAAPHNHGHVASFAVGGNYTPGTVANVGSKNGFLSLTDYYYNVSVNQRAIPKKIFKQVHFYVLQNVEPKVGPPIICKNAGRCEIGE